MNLILDVGNSLVKCALFQKGEILEKHTFSSSVRAFDVDNLILKHNPQNVIWCGVSETQKALKAHLAQKVSMIEVNYLMKLPFQNLYKTPATLGHDRIALVGGAALLYPNRPVLVVDAGSCVTFDFINKNGQYFGGSISPGLNMRYKALNHFTDKLPVLSPVHFNNFSGNNTAEAIHAGVYQGFLYEIQTRINQYVAENEFLTIILTGGDLDYLRIETKNRIFANPNFLLESLNALLDYNLLDD